MTAPVGIHVIANSPGYSRDSAVLVAKQIGASYAVVVNDPQLVAMLESIGVQCVYRVKDAAFDDDNAHQHFKASEYVARLRRDLAAYGVTEAWFYGDNEPGNQDLPVLRDWLLDFLNAIEAFGGHGVLVNLAYRNYTMADWDVLAPVMKRVREGNHRVGAHEGYDLEFPTITASSGGLTTVPEAIGRFKAVQDKYGVKFMITEFAASKDAYNGWQTWLTADQFASRVEDAVKQVYTPTGTPVCIFSTFPWQTGFDYYQAEALKTDFAAINVMYPLKDVPIVVQPTTPDRMTLGTPVDAVITHTASDVVNVRADVTTTSAVLTTLKTGDAIRVRPTLTAKINGYQWNAIEAPVVGWAANVFTWSASQDTNRVVIPNVAYFNEFQWAAGWTALCGETSLYMQLVFDRQWRRVAFPQEITPLSIAHYLGKAQKEFSSLNDLDNAAIAYGIKMHGDTGLFTDPFALLKTEVDAHRPVICLIDYSKLPTRWDKNFLGGHILVVVGFSDQSIICHDPDSPDAAHGAYVSYPRADFLAAWSALGSTALVLSP